MTQLNEASHSAIYLCVICVKSTLQTKLGHIVTTNWLQLDEGLLTVDKQTVCFLSVTVELATPPFDCVSTSDHLTVSLCIDGDCETNGLARASHYSFWLL